MELKLNVPVKHMTMQLGAKTLFFFFLVNKLKESCLKARWVLTQNKKWFSVYSTNIPECTPADEALTSLSTRTLFARRGPSEHGAADIRVSQRCLTATLSLCLRLSPSVSSWLSSSKMGRLTLVAFIAGKQTNVKTPQNHKIRCDWKHKK